MIGVPLQMRTRATKRSQVLNRKIPAIGEHGVEHGRAMTLRQDEAITIWPFWLAGVVPHYVIVKGDQQFRGAEAATNMAGASRMRRRHDQATHLAGDLSTPRRAISAADNRGSRS